MWMSLVLITHHATASLDSLRQLQTDCNCPCECLLQAQVWRDTGRKVADTVGAWVSSDMMRERRGAGCHHLLTTCPPHSSHINLSHAQQCKAAFQQAKRPLASCRHTNVRLMLHTDPGHILSLYTVADKLRQNTMIGSGHWTDPGQVREAYWQPILQWGIVIVRSCCIFN